MDNIRKLARALDVAQKKSDRLCSARAALPPGSSRARVTSANAKWARAAEARDMAWREVDEAIRNQPETGPYVMQFPQGIEGYHQARREISQDLCKSSLESLDRAITENKARRANDEDTARSEAARLLGAASASKAGKASADAAGPAERKLRATAGGKAAQKKLTKAERSRRAKLGWEKRKAKHGQELPKKGET